jgi:hypothetical protein
MRSPGADHAIDYGKDDPTASGRRPGASFDRR